LPSFSWTWIDDVGTATRPGCGRDRVINSRATPKALRNRGLADRPERAGVGVMSAASRALAALSWFPDTLTRRSPDDTSRRQDCERSRVATRRNRIQVRPSPRVHSSGSPHRTPRRPAERHTGVRLVASDGAQTTGVPVTNLIRGQRRTTIWRQRVGMVSACRPSRRAWAAAGKSCVKKTGGRRKATDRPPSREGPGGQALNPATLRLRADSGDEVR
jgi:hypothetical protein